MKKRRALIFMILVLAMAALPWGTDLGLSQSQAANNNNNGNAHQNQLKDAENAAAALRKSQGLMQYTTNDDRLAAAQRNAARRDAAAKGKGKGGSK